MTTKLEQAARQALSTDEALMALELILRDGIEHGNWPLNKNCEDGLEAITALRKTLAKQAEQEPVAYALSHLMGLEFGSKYPMQETKEAAEQMARQHMGAVVVTPLYAAPVQQAEQEPVCECRRKTDAVISAEKEL